MTIGEIVTLWGIIVILASGIALVVGVTLIKAQKRVAHMQAMMVACGLAAVFVVLYLTKLALKAGKEYAGPEEWRIPYYVLLVSHSILAAANLPLAVMAFINARKGLAAAGGLEPAQIAASAPAQSFFAKHRAWVKWTVPVWLYVAVTGWIIYVTMENYGAYKHM